MPPTAWDPPNVLLDFTQHGDTKNFTMGPTLLFYYRFELGGRRRHGPLTGWLVIGRAEGPGPPP